MKFRRKSGLADQSSAESEASESEAEVGPFDAEDLSDDDTQRVDLGSLLIAPAPGLELRMRVDEKSGQVQAVMLASGDGALELRAFAAPRHGDLWSEVRPQIAADMAQRGGVAEEREGRFGPELLCELTTRLPDGRTGRQTSRIIGINGSRWLLRATLLGAPARATEGVEAWEELITQVAVRRGDRAMPVGEALPVVVPEQARRVDP